MLGTIKHVVSHIYISLTTSDLLRSIVAAHATHTPLDHHSSCALDANCIPSTSVQDENDLGAQKEAHRAERKAKRKAQRQNKRGERTTYSQ